MQISLLKIKNDTVMTELDIIEVTKDMLYRINGIENRTFSSKAEAAGHIKKLKGKKKK